jgi:hypothetical protein
LNSVRLQGFDELFNDTGGMADGVDGWHNVKS